MIVLDNVTKVYGKTVAVREVNLRVNSGEVFGFLGPNGAGKTTTLKMLAGLLRPTEGSLVIAGYDIQKQPIAAKGAIGFVPDKPFIYEKLTGQEFLDFICDVYNMAGDEKVIARQRSLMRMFSLTEWLDELVESYSHGMRQKLIITSALMHYPKALVIDEPMVGLDAKGMRQVKELFRNIAAEGATVLLSTHTMSVAQEVCDRIGILSKGRLIAVGTMEELADRAGKKGCDLEEIFLKLTEQAGLEPE